MMQADVTLDCFGLLCPMPVIKTAERMKQLQVGQVLEVLSTDEGIGGDMPAWCRATGQEFLGMEKNNNEYKIYIRKTKAGE